MLKVTAKFKCVVRVVAAMPYLAKNLLSSIGKYRMQLTLEDSTARVHAFVTGKDGVRSNFNLSVDFRILGTNYTPCTYSFYSNDVTLYYLVAVTVFNLYSWHLFALDIQTKITILPNYFVICLCSV